MKGSNVPTLLLLFNFSKISGWLLRYSISPKFEGKLFTSISSETLIDSVTVVIPLSAHNCLNCSSVIYSLLDAPVYLQPSWII